MDGRSIEAVRDAMGKAGIKIGTETIHRAVLGKSGNRLASLQKIADFFGVSVDQLLQDDLGANADAWPFSAELYKEISSLEAEELQTLEVAMWAHIRKPLPEVLQHQRLESARRVVEQKTASISVTKPRQHKRMG